MNKKQRQKQRNKIYAILKDSGEDLNRRKGVNIHGDNYNHFMVKSAIYKILNEAGHKNVYTEVRFPNDCIADVLDTHLGIVYEVETDYIRSEQRSKWKDFDYNWINDVLVLDPADYRKTSLDKLKEQIRSELVLND